MEHEILEGISRADIAFRVRGKDLEELFSAGSRALVAIMLENPGSVAASLSVSFTCASGDIELLYFDFLSEIIYYKDSEHLLLLPEQIVIASTPEGYSLSCTCRGDRIERARHNFCVDIKAVTMHSLRVENEDGLWSATAVVDV